MSSLCLTTDVDIFEFRFMHSLYPEGILTTLLCLVSLHIFFYDYIY